MLRGDDTEKNETKSSISKDKKDRFATTNEEDDSNSNYDDYSNEDEEKNSSSNKEVDSYNIDETITDADFKYEIKVTLCRKMFCSTLGTVFFFQV